MQDLLLRPLLSLVPTVSAVSIPTPAYHPKPADDEYDRSTHYRVSPRVESTTVAHSLNKRGVSTVAPINTGWAFYLSHTTLPEKKNHIFPIDTSNDRTAYVTNGDNSLIVRSGTLVSDTLSLLQSHKKIIDGSLPAHSDLSYAGMCITFSHGSHNQHTNITDALLRIKGVRHNGTKWEPFEVSHMEDIVGLIETHFNTLTSSRILLLEMEFRLIDEYHVIPNSANSLDTRHITDLTNENHFVSIEIKDGLYTVLHQYDTISHKHPDIIDPEIYSFKRLIYEFFGGSFLFVTVPYEEVFGYPIPTSLARCWWRTPYSKLERSVGKLVLGGHTFESEYFVRNISLKQAVDYFIKHQDHISSHIVGKINIRQAGPNGVWLQNMSYGKPGDALDITNVFRGLFDESDAEVVYVHRGKYASVANPQLLHQSPSGKRT